MTIRSAVAMAASAAVVVAVYLTDSAWPVLGLFFPAAITEIEIEDPRDER